MAMDVPTTRDTEEPEETDEQNGALSFASTESAKSELEPTVLDRVPRLHILLIGIATGSTATAACILLVSVLV